VALLAPDEFGRLLAFGLAAAAGALLLAKPVVGVV